jgi:hypothetical protein
MEARQVSRIAWIRQQLQAFFSSSISTFAPLSFIACAVLFLVRSLSFVTITSASSPCLIIHPSDRQVEWTCHRIVNGETLEHLFGDDWVDVARFNRIDRRHVRAGIEIKAPVSLHLIKHFTPLPSRYPRAEAHARFILIDLSEQFLGAYEYGQLIFSSPVTTGNKDNDTPTGEFRISAAEVLRRSTLYTMEGTDIPFPMTYALRFHIDRDGVGFWIHGRDLPGMPASHGCVGLYDEEMQKRYYGVHGTPGSMTQGGCSSGSSVRPTTMRERSPSTMGRSF